MVDDLATRQGAGEATGRVFNVVLWVLQVVTAVGYALSALAKFTLNAQAVQVFVAMGTVSWMPYVIGVLEVAGAIGLLIPRLSGTAALAFVGLMAGALISHGIWGGDPTPAVMFLVLVVVLAWGRRSTTRALLAGGARS